MAGWVLIAAGLALAAWALRAYRQAGGRARRGPPILLDEGAYAYSRHPMYAGLALGLLGWAASQATLGAALAVLLVNGLWVGAASRWLIPAEERRLAQAFGGWWHDYRAQVRPWL